MWENLDRNVKRYIIFAGILLVGLLLFRTCGGSEAAAPPPPRGITQ